MTYYVGGIAFDGNNALSHLGESLRPGRPKGSKNGYHLFGKNPYTPVGRIARTIVRGVSSAYRSGKEFLTASNSRAAMKNATNATLYKMAYDRYKKTLPGIMATTISSIRAWFYKHSYAHKKAQRIVARIKRRNYLANKPDRTYAENRELKRMLDIELRESKRQAKLKRENEKLNKRNNAILDFGVPDIYWYK